MVVMAPADENECRQMLYTAVGCGRPAAVRDPRGSGPGAKIESQMSCCPIGKAELRRAGQRLALLAFGPMVPACRALAEAHDMTLVNMRFIKPLDVQMVLEIAAHHEAIVTVEENVVAGGAGSAVNDALLAADQHLPVLNCGIPDRFVEHGSREDCLVSAGLDAASLERRILHWWHAHAVSSRRPARPARSAGLAAVQS
jgi:1-deoxy-D-xylulose-5-phosphate synthase